MKVLYVCALSALTACSAAPADMLADGGLADGGLADAGLEDAGLADSGVDPTDPAIVVTTIGAIRGELAGDVLAFRGVPFAKPPVGELRFRPPEPPDRIEGVLDATTFAAKCPQLEDNAPIGGEDCLYLNLWTPAIAPGNRALPILFFIHGGGNAQGSTSQGTGGQVLYDGRFLTENHQTIVVTTAYRLGPLGWLAHPELDAESARGVSGNYGILDQLAALQWIRDNAAAFGGDPDEIVIFGESAGARDVCVLYASPLAAGLFAGAIMESGGCSVPVSTAVREISREQIMRSGCTGAGGGEIACLRAKTASQLLLDLPPDVSVIGRSSALQPHVDGWVLAGQPVDEVRAGRHNHVPLIVGANSDETALFAPDLPTAEAYEQLVLDTFGPMLGQRVLAVYPAANYPTPRAAYVAVTSDSKFICTARRDARAAAEGQNEPVYRYFFAQRLENAPRLRAFGAYHGLELFFVFGNLDYAGYRPTAAERELAETIGGYWTNLAFVGDPNEPGLPVWETYRGAADATLVLTATAIAMREGIRTAECDFWDSLP